MYDSSESLGFNRVNPVLSDFNNYKKKFNEKRRRNKKEYAEIMKEVTEDIEKSNDNGHINLKI
ncbi:MAG: hypothetical protein HWN67_19925 [Candidatus Helarchaeota archaeon]|nr:hypothetical protein [Candidatus Helarchaeota archaeon]